MIPVDGRDQNLLREHGTMTSEQILPHALTYAANDAYMMHHCIMNSDNLQSELFGWLLHSTFCMIAKRLKQR